MNSCTALSANNKDSVQLASHTDAVASYSYHRHHHVAYLRKASLSFGKKFV